MAVIIQVELRIQFNLLANRNFVIEIAFASCFRLNVDCDKAKPEESLAWQAVYIPTIQSGLFLRHSDQVTRCCT